ncbi:MAG TPA: YdcF family protein [Acidimicrobiales bacterium]
MARSRPAPETTEPGPGRARRAVDSIGALRDKKGRRRLYVKMVGVAGVLMLGYLAVTFVQVWWASRQDGAREADAVVVLGAAQYDGRPSEVLRERLDHALELYEAGMVEVIVVTGGKQEGDRFTEAYTGYLYLRERNVPEEALLTEVQGRNSWESIAAAARILRDRGWTDAVMVTDGYHALRVDAIADELGLDASVSPSRPGGSLKDLVKETGAVALGRVVGFRRLVDVDDRIDNRIVSQE